LRTKQTELFRIRDIFTVQALSHPDIGMSFTVDGREMHRLPAADTLDDRIRELFSPELIKQLKNVEYAEGGIKVSGKISLPTLNRADRNEQYLFVNGRPTSPSLLSYAIHEGYRGMLPKGRHPSIFMFLEMPPDWVDVNVHPTKREIRFRRPGDVRDGVIAAVKGALSVKPEVLDVDEGFVDVIGTIGQLPPQETTLAIDDLPPPSVFKYPRATVRPVSEPVTGAMFDALAVSPEEYEKTAAGVPAPDETGSPQSESVEPSDALHTAPWNWCRVLGQIGGLYVILETEKGMVMMDPRASHERVLYDRFMRSVIAESVQVQNLLLPESVELPARDAARIRRNIKIFQNMGFGISEFGGNSFVIDALPACFDGVPISELLLDMVRSLEEAGSRGGEHAKEDALAQAACRVAVGTRQRLTLAEIERLVVDLAACEMPYTSPRGRPTLIFTSFNELHKKFGRT
jgi:DNA mismatch repair protein MutL